MIMSGRLAHSGWRNGLAALALATLAVAFAAPAEATKIERVVSPGGIEAWLVSDKTVPLIAVDFAFRGGANQDPAGKTGVAQMTTELLDEGAGGLDARAFQQQLEERAITLGFSAGHDNIRGSLRTLSENRREAFELLRLALTAPRFDAPPVERIRVQIMTRLRRETTSPNDIASRRWWEAAFGTHPYARPVGGTLESVPLIAADDLKAYVARIFARDNLKIAVVGDIDAATLSASLDEVFGGLPAKAQRTPIASANPDAHGQRIVVDFDVPQAVVTFGGRGIARKDPDFIAAYIVNHILGGGSFSSRLYKEVREKRGLAYSVYSSLVWLDHAALFMGGTGTRAERSGDTIEIIQQEIRRLAEVGPTDDELAKAKSFLKGSYPLNFDTSTKIAGQLVQIQLDDLGIDYIDKRSSLIDAVTLADAKRVAKRLLEEGLIVTVVGRANAATGAPGAGVPATPAAALPERDIHGRPLR